jgi:hypothetical protein
LNIKTKTLRLLALAALAVEQTVCALSCKVGELALSAAQDAVLASEIKLAGLTDDNGELVLSDDDMQFMFDEHDDYLANLAYELDLD